MNEWTNERTNKQTCRPCWSEISTTVKALLQNKLSRVYMILGPFFTRHWTKIAVLFASFEANDLPVPGLRVWAVTSAVMFSPENMFGFDIPADVRKRYCRAGDFAELYNKNNFSLFLYFKIDPSISRKLKGIACLIHEKYRKTAINYQASMISHMWLQKMTLFRQKQKLKLAFYRPHFWQIIYSSSQRWTEFSMMVGLLESGCFSCNNREF